MVVGKALAGGLLACGLVAEAVGVSGGINSAAFASGYVPGLQPRAMGGSIVARSVGAASTSSATARGLVVGLRAQHQNGDTSRREALSLAIAAGVSFFGSASAHAAGSTGPEGVDGPSAKKMAITQSAPGLDRNKIKVNPELALKEPKLELPANAKELTKTYKVTESGVFYKDLKEGAADGVNPKDGDTVVFQYIGQVCEVDKDGEYDCAPREAPEVYPTLPQGIAADSPKYDSSYLRGRPQDARLGKSQISLGLEEAIKGMKPGGVRMVFLVPELSISCPKGRVCVAEIDTSERISLYVELLSVNGKGDSNVKEVAAPAYKPGPPRIVRKRLWGSAPGSPPVDPAPAAAPAKAEAAAPALAPSAPPAPAK